MDIFLVASSGGITQLVFGFLSERTTLCIALNLSVEGGKFTMRLCLHLGDMTPQLSLHSFLWLNNISLCASTKVCLFTHLLMNVWADSTFWLL